VFVRIKLWFEGISLVYQAIAAVIGLGGLAAIYLGPMLIGPGKAAQESFEYGVSYFKDHDYDKAEAAFSRAIDSSSNYADAIHYRARSRVAKHDYTAALADLKTLNSLEPKNARGHTLAGFTYFQIRDFPLAEVELNKALRISPDDELALFTRAQYHSWRHNYKGTVTDLQRLLIVKPESEKSIRLLAGAYSRLGEVEKAAAQCRRLIRLNRRDAHNPELCGLIHHRAGDYEKAIQYYTDALALEPAMIGVKQNIDRAKKGDPPLGTEEA